MKAKISTTLTVWGVILNLFLFIIKITAGVLGNSIAIISDAINSLVDVISSVFIFISVKLSLKGADKDHPFGHNRMQPLAAYTVAIFTAIFGFELIVYAIKHFMTPVKINFSLLLIFVPVITMAIKFLMATSFISLGKKLKSPAIKASGIDSRNDIFSAFIALVAVIASFYGYHYVDSIVAIIISLFIFYSGYKLAIENMDYLLGKAAPNEYIGKIKEKALGVKGVEGINDIRAHYVGNMIHIEVCIQIPKRTTTKRSHDIGSKVKEVAEDLPYIDKAFVHIDPV